MVIPMFDDAKFAEIFAPVLALRTAYDRKLAEAHNPFHKSQSARDVPPTTLPDCGATIGDTTC